jgi:hypothetical protein
MGHLAARDMGVEHVEDRADGGLGIAQRVGREGRLHPRDEAREAPPRHRRLRGVVALVIDPPDQDRQLRRQLRGLVGVHVVAQRMQHRAQQAVGPLLVVPAGPVIHLVEPDIRLLDGFVDDLEAQGTHGSLPRRSDAPAHPGDQRSTSRDRAP